SGDGNASPAVDPDNPAALEHDVLMYDETYLINEARLAGHDVQNGRPLSELELLAALQHYGAVTRLLDFSRNMAVALWFASSEISERPGLSIGIDAQKNKATRNHCRCRTHDA